MQIVCSVLSACLFLVVAGIGMAQTKDPCSDQRSRRAWETGIDPVYADAMELTRTLEAHGFFVECVRSSKQSQIFDGQKGAAWYKSDHGIFEVLFLPKGQTFDELKIVAKSREGYTVYSFRGKPSIPGTMESKSRIAFIKHENLMFQVSGDDPLTKSLGQVFQNR